MQSASFSRAANAFEFLGVHGWHGMLWMSPMLLELNSRLLSCPIFASYGTCTTMNPPTSSSPSNPAIRWRRGELIGVGAFGSVYMGMNLDSGELFAVKQVLVPSNTAARQKTQAHLRELEEEVKLLKNLSHPNIVRYLGTSRDENTLNIFLEFVPGGSITSLLSKFGPFPEMVIRMYTRQLLQGLEYLHMNKIMHRDIKGANILVDNKGHIKLADFGSSKQVVELVTTTGSKSIKGTPYWMAPEVITQTGHDLSADVWSVGCTVIEMATGKAPWSQQFQEIAAMFHIGTTKSHPPIPEHLSPVAQDFLLKCLNQEPELRPTASELLEHPFVKVEEVSAISSPTQGSELFDSCKRRQLSSNEIEEPHVQGSSNILTKENISLKLFSPPMSEPPTQSCIHNLQDAEDVLCNLASPDIFTNKESPLATENKYFNEDTRLFFFKHMPADAHNEEDDEEITEAKIKAFLEEKALELKRLQTPLFMEFHSSWNVQENQDGITIASCREQRGGSNNIIMPQSCSWTSSSSKTPSKDNSVSGLSVVQSSGSEPSISSRSCDTGNHRSNLFSCMNASGVHDLKEHFMETQRPSCIPSPADRLKLWEEELQLELKMRREERRMLSGVSASPNVLRGASRSLKRKQP